MLIGVQLNQNLYAPEFVNARHQTVQGNVPPSSIPDVERKLRSLAPQFVRIFFNAQQDEADPTTRPSFVRTAQLAQAVGAKINVTLNAVPSYPKDPGPVLTLFASALKELVATYHVTNVAWVTLQNEPNTDDPPIKGMSPPVLDAAYRALDKILTQNGLRPHIGFMGGDLIEGAPMQKSQPDPELPPKFDQPSTDWSLYTNEAYWLTWMKNHTSALLDAYSLHIYWDVIDDMPPPADRVVKFKQRLATMQKAGKPVYVTEYGVRGIRPKGYDGPGTYEGEPLQETKIAAFQHAWFQIAAASVGCAGVSKWDAYYALYDSDPQAYYAMGEPANDIWACYPMYYLLWLFTNGTNPAWKTGSVPVTETWEALCEFRGGAHELTVFGLDTRWANSNKISKQVSTYEIPTGLVSGTRLSLVVWNRDGGGQLTHQPAQTATGKQGIVTINVPQHAVFALTTIALPPLPGTS